MIVFKNYFKIVKKFLPIIIIYTTIFMIFAVLTTTINSESMFDTVKPNIAVVNNDNSKITDTFIDYIKSKTVIVPVKSDEESLKDSLFYREVDYVVIIPNGFGDSIISQNPKKIETMKVPSSYNSTYTEMLFNRFLNIASMYAKAGMNDDQISSLITKDLEEKTNVIVISNNQNLLEKANYFYNFANYTILAISILIVGMLINIYNNKNIKKRNLISTLSYKKINFEIFLGNACLTFIIWLMYVIISIILYKNVMFTTNGILLIINSFAFAFSALSIGTLVGNLVSSREAQNGIVNIVALGSSFLCGAFVPQQFLGDFVLNLGKVFPSYWYIKNNNDISLLSNINYDTLSPIIINMIIIVAYGVIFFIITNIITKLKLKSN